MVWPRVGSATITGALRVVTVNIPIHPLSPLHFLEGINLLRIGSGFCFPWRYVDGVSGSHRLAIASLMTGPRRGLSHGVLARSQSSIMQPFTCR